MNGEVYETVVERTSAGDDMGLYAILIACETREGRISEIERIFSYAAERKIDQKAYHCWEWLKWAIEDIEFIPLFDPKSPKEHIVPYGKERDEATRRAAIAKARKAMELCQRYCWGKDTTHFPKTSAALVNEIANGWKETGAEEEANSFFEFLVKLKLEPSFPEKEQQKILEAIRKVTDSHFPVKRLVYNIHYLLDFEERQPEYYLKPSVREITRVLVLGWSRRDTTETTPSILAISPLEGASPQAFELIKRIAQEIVAFDTLAKGLKVFLNGTGTGWGTDDGGVKVEKSLGNGRYEVYHCRAKLSYPALNAIAVLLDIKDSDYDENFLHDVFVAVKAKIAEWRRENQGIAVSLELKATSRYQSDGKSYMTRREEV
jgi:hypothetical protein